MRYFYLPLFQLYRYKFARNIVELSKKFFLVQKKKKFHNFAHEKKIRKSGGCRSSRKEIRRKKRTGKQQRQSEFRAIPAIRRSNEVAATLSEDGNAIFAGASEACKRSGAPVTRCRGTRSACTQRRVKERMGRERGVPPRNKAAIHIEPAVINVSCYSRASEYFHLRASAPRLASRRRIYTPVNTTPFSFLRVAARFAVLSDRDDSFDR